VNTPRLTLCPQIKRTVARFGQKALDGLVLLLNSKDITVRRTALYALFIWHLAAHFKPGEAAGVRSVIVT
jgi:hypothetical protein